MATHKTQEHFEVVQVIKRADISKTPIEWYDGDKFSTAGQARASLNKLAKEFPKTDYTILHTLRTEIK